jgi:hypothetical protein
MMIVLLLGAYHRNGARHCWTTSFCAWLLMVACGSETILILTGNYGQVSIPEIAINLALLVAVWGVRGNVSLLARRPQNKKGNR